jgi:hypothetical protein
MNRLLKRVTNRMSGKNSSAQSHRLSNRKRLLMETLEQRALMAGDIYYVGLAGSNDNPGTQEAPFATVAKASSVVQPGDTVRLLGGTYRNATFGDGNVWKDGNDQVFRIVGVNGTAEEPITFEPNPGDHVKLQFDGNGGVRINQSTHVRFRGFEIEGPGESILMEDMLPYQFAYRLPNDDTVYYRDPAATLTQSIASLGGYKPNYFNSNGLAIGNGSDHIEIVDNIVRGAPGYGISSLGGAEYLSIINNEVYNNSWWAGGNHGISVQNLKSTDTYDGFKVIIQGNELKDNYARTISWATLKKDPVEMTIDEGKGIHLQENTAADGFLHGRILVANNTVVNSGRAGIAENDSERVTIVNNTLVNNAYANTLFAMGMLDPQLPSDFQATDGGIRLQGGDDFEIYNNLIVVSAGGSAVAGSQGQTSDVATAGNNFYVGDLATNNHAAFLAAGFTQISDAGFVDPVNGNYELRLDSAAIDAGDTSFVMDIAVQTSTGLARDIDGDARIFGGSIDIGAHENSLAFNPSAQESIRDQLLDGVNRIADQGTEGTIAVFGDDAASVLRDPVYGTVVAAVDDGTSRIVAAARTNYVDFGNANRYDTAKFYHNTLNWLSHGQGTSARIVTDLSSARTWLQNQGYTNVSLRTDWENGLTNADVLVTRLSNASTAQQAALDEFLANGNGLFAGYNGWAYGSGVTPLNSGGNAVLRNWGLSWTDKVAWSFDGTIQKGTAFGNAVLADEILRNSSQYGSAEHVEMATAVVSTFPYVPPSDTQIATIRNRILDNATSLTPTPTNGISGETDRALLRIEAAALEHLPAEELFEHRTAFSYGEISVNASRVTESRSYTINATNASSQWLSTGLYAAPGDVVTLTVPADLVDAGWSWKIGSHDDNNSGVSVYRRMPTGISRDVPINATTTIHTGSVYGGMIYLVKPATSANESATYQVQIANALKAPTFVLGETTDAEWVATIRDYPAPQTELISNNLIISMHSSDTHSLTNPTSVMTYWNDIVAVQDHLVNAPVPRTRPERIDDDLQISNGWMHAGYPIAAYANNLVNMIDSDPGDDWGFFHEIGHNHQSSLWTFSGETEITVNILSMRSYDSVGTVPSDNWSGMWTDEGRASRIPAFVAGGRVRSDAANSLVAYAQLRAGFGWEPFEQFFRSYQTDASSNLPTTDQQKRDQWVTRFSNVVGKNLGPFFQAWGFNPSQAALDAVSNLPAWSKIEAVTPDLNHFTQTAQPITIDPRSGFVDVIGGTLQLSFEAPTHGVLTTNADGSVTYTPATNWNGYETLNYTVTNDFGGTASGTATILTGVRVTTSTATDSDIAEANSNTNYGTANTLQVDGSPLRQGLLQFSNLFGTDAGQIPADAEIVSATLSVTVTDSGSSLNFHRMLQPWDAATATWNSMNSGIQTDGIEAVATADLSTGFVSTGARTYDVTNSLVAWNTNPNITYGWVILPTSNNGVSIASAESSTPPTLTVQYFIPQRDTTAPVATVQPLPLTTSTNEISLNILLSDQAGQEDTFVSGVASYDVYVAVDKGSWTLLASEVPASQTTLTFIPESNHRYWFRADARDHAGNVEVGVSAEANTKTTDIAPPITSVVSATPDSNGLFILSLQGTDAGDSRLRAFRVYVRVDDGPVRSIPRVLAGASDSNGDYSATTTYQGLRDGSSHQYTFFTRGIDFAGNLEDAPDTATGDWQGSHTFQPPVSLVAKSIDVQSGETQRSYVRHVDVLFNDESGLADLIAGSRIQVEKFALNNASPTQGTGTLVDFSSASVQGNSITLDFGAGGIGGSGNTGNGFYRIALDLDGDGQFDDGHFEFFQLWGDSNGDGMVDIADRIVTEDINGDGVINARDRAIYRTELNKRLLPSLYGEIDD